MMQAVSLSDVRITHWRNACRVYFHLTDAFRAATIAQAAALFSRSLDEY
jgi:hypothetical protein